jgi:hypothetical protein
MEKLTRQQQKALHLLFGMIAQELNNCGMDMRKTLKPEIDIPWTKETIKDFLWRPIQRAQLGKESTTELTRKEVDQVYDTINRFFGQKLQVEMPLFPSLEQLIEYDEFSTGKGVAKNKQ